MATQQQILRMSRVLARVLADASAASFVLMLWLARLANICQAVLRQSGEFGKCRLYRFMHIKYVICA